jgi:CRP-like cAMP-binding protein
MDAIDTQAIAALAQAIGATWFGAGVPPEARTRLASLGRVEEVPGGTRLLREGDETRELGLVLSGRVGLTEHIPSRGVVTLLTVEPGDIFGWSALLAPYRATSTCTTLEPARLVLFPAAPLRAALRADVDLASGVYRQVLEAVARRLLATREQLLDVYRVEGTEPW